MGTIQGKSIKREANRTIWAAVASPHHARASVKGGKIDHSQSQDEHENGGGMPGNKKQKYRNNREIWQVTGKV